jgi:hypothetical protein
MPGGLRLQRVSEELRGAALVCMIPDALVYVHACSVLLTAGGGVGAQLDAACLLGPASPRLAALAVALGHIPQQECSRACCSA